MNREILFRGKSTDDKWHYGDYHYCMNTPFTDDRHEIIDRSGLGYNCPAETIGQYTGLTDKNSVKIFEGDICRVGNLTYQVVFQYSQWWFSIVDPSVDCCPYFDSHCGEHCEVIGNIHDENPLIAQGARG